MTRIYVVAWWWNDGAGRRWSTEEKPIAAEYAAQTQCEAQLFGEKHGYRVKQFEVEVPWEINESVFGKMAVDMFLDEWLENAVL